ncbi:MAG: flagellar basal-body rod protein FlgF, partial [Calditrichia bacterium]
DVLSNNIANINTQGFKKDILVYEEKAPPFQQTPLNGFGTRHFNAFDGSDPAVSYVQATESQTDFTQGSLIKTDNPLDVAIEGKGFFVVNTPTGIRYTRNGNFRLDGLGQLVDRKGNMIMTRDEEPILIPIDTKGVSIDQDGSIFGGAEGDQEPLGRLKIVDFNNLQALTKEGEGFYKISDSSVKEILVNDAKVLQGFTENSNANAIHEMTQMIETVRQLEAYQKIIQSIDEADDQSVNNLGRVA